MSLTTTSRKFKKNMKYGFFILLFYYILTLFLVPQTKAIIEEIQAMREPPTPEYGKLEALRFNRSNNTSIGSEVKFVLNTKNGKLPTGIPRKLPVFKFKPVLYSYLAGVRAQQQADVLGYKSTELISDLKGKVYSWRSLTSGGSLTINTETGSIIAKTDLYDKGNIYKAGRLDANSARAVAKEVLRDLGVYNSEQLDAGPQKVILGTFINSNLIDTAVTAEAELAEVNFYRSVSAKYPILGPDPSKSLMSVTVSSLETPDPVYNYPVVDVQFWDYVKETKSTYPIISVAEAWKQLSTGKAVPVSVMPKGGNQFKAPERAVVEKVLISKVYLAYYETKEFQKYMQPIYVFEGNYSSLAASGGNITFYFPAIAAEMIKTIEPIKVPVNTPTPIVTPTPNIKPTSEEVIQNEETNLPTNTSPTDTTP